MRTFDWEAIANAAITQIEDGARKARYRTDPVAWVADTTGEYLWSKQRELIEAVVKHRKVAVKAGHGVGKSMSVSRLVAWWVANHDPQETQVITTAPSWEQVEGVLWRELQIAHGKSGDKLPGTITGDCKWRLGPYVVAKGRKPADRNQHGVQGTHAKYVLAVGDEACGLSPEIIEGLANIVTGDDCRMLLIGNPDDPNSRFGELCKGSPTDGASGMSDAGWWVINISVLGNPFFTGEEVPPDVLEAMPKDSYLNEKRLEVGEGTPLWTSKILGQFPEDAADGIIPSSWVNACRNLPADRPAPTSHLVELGIDVGASDNGDQTVVWERRGPRAGRRWAIRERDHVKLAAWIVHKIRVTRATAVKIDATGVGHGLANILSAYGAKGKHGATIVEVNFGSRAHRPERFRNCRAEMHWMMRELVQHKAVDLTPVEGSEIHTGIEGSEIHTGIEDGVAAELTSPKYTMDTAGRVLVTPKDEIREQLGRSPDDGDALLLAYYTPPLPRNGGRLYK